MNLEGKVALVTGAARGIGLAVATQLAHAGAHVVCCDRCPEADAAAALAPVTSARHPGVFYQADVSDRAAVDRLMEWTIERFGHLDILVNNAAKNIRKPLLELDVADVEQVWAVSLWGVFHCTQAAARHMAQRKSGSIVMISSIHAAMAYPRSTAYNGAKAAVNHMARTWATELAASDIRVNIVEPGWTDTPGERQFFTEEQLAEGGRTVPLGRLARPDEIAAAVCFLASDAASYITGSTLRVDGAMSLPH